MVRVLREGKCGNKWQSKFGSGTRKLIGWPLNKCQILKSPTLPFFLSNFGMVSSLENVVLTILLFVLLLSLWMARTQFLPPSSFMAVSWLRRMLCISSSLAVICQIMNNISYFFTVLAVTETSAQAFWIMFVQVTAFHFQYFLLTAANLNRYRRMLPIIRPDNNPSSSIYNRYKNDAFVFGTGAFTFLLCTAAATAQLLPQSPDWQVYIVGLSCLWIIFFDCYLDMNMIYRALSAVDHRSPFTNANMRKSSMIAARMSEMGKQVNGNNVENVHKQEEKIVLLKKLDKESNVVGGFSI